jgi:hypothetical protein
MTAVGVDGQVKSALPVHEDVSLLGGEAIRPGPHGHRRLLDGPRSTGELQRAAISLQEVCGGGHGFESRRDPRRCVRRGRLIVGGDQGNEEDRGKMVGSPGGDIDREQAAGTDGHGGIGERRLGVPA